MKKFLVPQNFSALAIQPIGSVLMNAGSSTFLAQFCASSISNTDSPSKIQLVGPIVRNQKLKWKRKERILLNRMRRTENRRENSPLHKGFLLLQRVNAQSINDKIPLSPILLPLLISNKSL